MVFVICCCLIICCIFILLFELVMCVCVCVCSRGTDETERNARNARQACEVANLVSFFTRSPSLSFSRLLPPNLLVNSIHSQNSLGSLKGSTSISMYIVDACITSLCYGIIHSNLQEQRMMWMECYG